MQLGCRVWIEWVSSESNLADILSRDVFFSVPTKGDTVDVLKLPTWADVRANLDIEKVFDTIRAYGMVLWCHHWYSVFR